ncbi:hypothetical protein HanXRQr2_Chr02g0072391 [Helianthus annuus]|uniref:Uncharacterized protein n=1 Tax=Helianthus annuus TaxID=4232 RepID=A0A9K3P0M0_HELAN|nr:hypothetical protein HanXRQr2_Chr02g0072391 [Helianthus annuus]KAJ0605210.1 hypothetical protein HanHA300_Chr02g0060441 [Helianthus annuus]KAJ0619186.1 hypothetical protein HanHA89_Chr02g0068541 [Helianthus annuus]KAJ0777637.1 hypothetical protein HanLR1_Chr02g0062781 [Helianthus annuus]KAJ0786663.1 hypothetical protein HanOQP8_Chr02g0073861 [Helianthus annuus]
MFCAYVKCTIGYVGCILFLLCHYSAPYHVFTTCLCQILRTMLLACSPLLPYPKLPISFPKSRNPAADPQIKNMSSPLLSNQTLISSNPQ